MMTYETVSQPSEVPPAAQITSPYAPLLGTVDPVALPVKVLEAPVENRYGLERMIAINSYVKKRARSIKVDDHTNISGRNGRGKTSLLRLIPLFLGELPSRMIKPSGEGMKPLREYIFDSLSSYLVFEYRNWDGLKLAIMFYGGQDTPSYILCDGGYDPALFVENGQFIESRLLNGRLKTMKRNPTPSIGVLEYQTVIQGRRDRARGGADIANHVRRFAIPEKGNLAGIERIASAMFFKDITFSALKRMIYWVMSDSDEDVIKTNMNPKSMNQFFNNFGAYQSVMKHDRDFVDGQKAHLAYQVALRDQRAVGIRANLLSAYQTDKSAELNVLIQKLSDQQREAGDAHAALLLSIDTNISTITVAIGQAEKTVLEIDREEELFKQQQIDEKRFLVESLPQIEARIDEAQKLLQVLHASSGNINQTFDSEVNNLFENTERRVKPLRAELTAAAQRADALQKNLSIELEAAREALSLHLEKSEARVLAEREMAEEKLAAYQEAKAALKISAEFEQKISSAVGHQVSLQKNIDDEYQKMTVLTSEQNLVKDSFNQADKRIAESSRQIQAKLAEREAKTKLHSPAETSLLAFLRENVPTWVDNVAKVVRDEVLLEENLTPQLVADALTTANLYGVDIDLSKINSPLVARESRLSEEIQDLNDVIAEAKRKYDLQEQDFRKLGQKLDTLRSAIGNSQAIIDVKKRQLSDASVAIASTRRAAEEELSVRREDIKLHIDAATKEKLRIKNLHGEMAAERRRREKDLAAEYSLRGKEIDAQLSQALARCNMSIQDEERQRDTAKGVINANRAAALRDGGVDMEALVTLQNQVNEQKGQRDIAMNALRDVDRYTRWLETRPAERQSGLSTISKDRSTVNGHNTERNKLVSDHAAYLDAVDKRRTSLSSERDALQSALGDVEKFRNKHNTAPLGDQLSTLFEPLGLTLEHIVKEWSHYAKQTKEAHLLRNNLIQKTHQSFMTSVANTHVRVFASTLPITLIDTDGENNNFDVAIAIFSNWYGGTHEQSREAINIECQAACGQFSSYHKKLNSFRDNVANLSRQLQNNLDADMKFDAIKSVSLRLSGRVERLPYWDELTSVIREYQRWQETECVGLPPSELYHQLSSMMSKIAGGRLEESPETLIDMEILVNDGTEKRVTNESELKNVSSNGLSYMIMCLIFLSFVNRVRKDKNVTLTWAIDEIGAIDDGNLLALAALLKTHNINLVSAAPQGSANILAAFKNHYEILPNFEIQHCLPAQKRKHHVA